MFNLGSNQTNIENINIFFVRPWIKQLTDYFIRSSQLFNRGSNNINNKYISSGTIGRTYQQQAFSEETLGIEGDSKEHFFASLAQTHPHL